MTITIANQKGGVGKTTLAYLIGECIANSSDKMKVVAKDYDPQKSLTAILEVAGGKMTIAEPHGKADCTIIDTPPNMGDALVGKAVSQSDLVLIPTQPTPTAIRATMNFIRSLNGRKAAVVWTTVKHGTVAAKQIPELNFGLKCFSQQIPDRVCFTYVSQQGITALDAEAREDMKKLTAEILKFISRKH